MLPSGWWLISYSLNPKTSPHCTSSSYRRRRCYTPIINFKLNPRNTLGTPLHPNLNAVPSFWNPLNACDDWLVSYVGKKRVSFPALAPHPPGGQSTRLRVTETETHFQQRHGNIREWGFYIVSRMALCLGGCCPGKYTLSVFVFVHANSPCVLTPV